MSDSNKVPRGSDRSRPSNRPHRERRRPDQPGAENNHSGRRSREDRREPRESHQSKPNPSRQPDPSSERYDPQGESYSRPPSLRLPPSQPNSRPSSSSPPYYTSASPTSTPPKESFGTKCSYLCSRREIDFGVSIGLYPYLPFRNYNNQTSFNQQFQERATPIKAFFSSRCIAGILQFTEIITNLMVLICVAAAQAAMSGYTSMGGLGAGAFSINSAYSPFQGTELQEVRDLDMQFSQMRTPGVYGGVVFSIVTGSLTLLFLVASAKPLHRLPPKLLMAEFVFNILACIGYIVGVGLYLHLIITVNKTEVCRLRNRLYARQGYTFMNCDVQGGDAAVALFGLISACLYCGSAVFSFLTLRTLKKILKDMYSGNAFHHDFEEVECTERTNHQEAKGRQQIATLM